MLIMIESIILEGSPYKIFSLVVCSGEALLSMAGMPARKVHIPAKGIPYLLISVYILLTACTSC